MLSLTNAILVGNLTEVQRNLSEEVNLEAIDEYGFTPLIEAVIASQPKIVELLLQKQVSVDNQDVTGRTALHWAVDNQDLSICKLLLDQQANPNAYNHGGQPLLVFPLLRAQKELKSILYKHG